MFPDEIIMISGDMPVLSFDNDRVSVYPSPWNGKEGIKNDVSGELGGIVILGQDNVNSMTQADTAKAILTLFQQFMIFPTNDTEIHHLAGIVEKLMKTIPIWYYANDGSESSTRILREMLLRYQIKEG